MRTISIAYSGRPFSKTFQAFESWLLGTAAAPDPDLVENGHMRFTAESARHLGPWLRRWQLLERASREALARCMFQPATRRGRPMAAPMMRVTSWEVR
jgi:hypothetical protein